ncbi:hypothetical protein [Achromobacter xylosoxidans]|uniref:hypothetical protein n=1 Tax=Alcaligenes xylosoxydans xylosoxydans TaxID=85698 RepID=UPI000F4DDE0E|nr:hypothetical protein [Achromobacter xylosoxidans]
MKKRCERSDGGHFKSGQNVGQSDAPSLQNGALYLAVANQCTDLIIKLSSVYLLASGWLLWTHLRSLNWAQLFLTSTSSPSGLAVLAAGMLAFIGLVLLVLMVPSMLWLAGMELYASNRPVPKRVRWVFFLLAFVWAGVYVAAGLCDELVEWLSPQRVFGIGILLGVLIYGMPAVWQAVKKGGGDCAEMRKLFWKSWTYSLLTEHPVKPPIRKSMNGGGRADVGRIWVPLVEKRAAMPGSNKIITAGRGVLSLFLPIFVVLLILVTALLTSLPILVLARLFGKSLESVLGTAPAWIVLILCGMLTLTPVYVYLSERSRNKGVVESTKQAFIASAAIVLLGMFSLMYAPLRDRVFSLLEIQSTKKEFFQVLSPSGAMALRNLDFSLMEMSVASKEVRQWSGGDAMAGLLIVQAWVGYAFGDTVLLCKQRVSEEWYSDPLQMHANICVPLARTELRRMTDIWPDT